MPRSCRRKSESEFNRSYERMLDEADSPISPRTPSSISTIDAPRGLADKTVTIASRTSPGRRRFLSLTFDVLGTVTSLRRRDVYVKLAGARGRLKTRRQACASTFRAIPPTAVGGCFGSAYDGTRGSRWKSHPRRWVDRSRPGYADACAEVFSNPATGRPVPERSTHCLGWYLGCARDLVVGWY